MINVFSISLSPLALNVHLFHCTQPSRSDWLISNLTLFSRSTNLFLGRLSPGKSNSWSLMNNIEQFLSSSAVHEIVIVLSMIWCTILLTFMPLKIGISHELDMDTFINQDLWLHCLAYRWVINGWKWKVLSASLFK